jgi:hypothetical protein
MSTRGAIAKPHGDGWIGRYHHSDSYPSGLGATLWEAYHGPFKGDAKAMQRYFVDEEPIAWSCVVGADFSLPPGWATGGPRSYRDRGDGETPSKPMICTCQASAVKDAECSPLFIEWAYVLTDEAMVIYQAKPAPYKRTPKGEVDPGYVHVLRHVIPWHGAEPKWDALESEAA